MAIYSTFFSCSHAELLEGFPDWRPPLAVPRKREMRNPFTKRISIVETYEPEWPEEKAPVETSFARRVIAVSGNYADYLEGRLPPFVQERPHWCAKGLTEGELGPLGELCGPKPVVEVALYCRPPSSKTLYRLQPDLLSKMLGVEKSSLDSIARDWAATMSSPERTHSVTGIKLNEGWQTSYAMSIMEQLIGLKEQDHQNDLFLLLEW
jgi:hypothetical protein